MKFSIVNHEELETFIKNRRVMTFRPGISQIYTVMGIREQIVYELAQKPESRTIGIFLMCDREPSVIYDSDGNPRTVFGFVIERFSVLIEVEA